MIRPLSLTQKLDIKCDDNQLFTIHNSGLCHKRQKIFNIFTLFKDELIPILNALRYYGYRMRLELSESFSFIKIQVTDCSYCCFDHEIV